MTVYRLICVPDNSDAFVEEFPTRHAAIMRATALIYDYEGGSPTPELAKMLRDGKTISFHDHSTVRIEEVE